MSSSSSAAPSRRNAALADALAGVLGSLVSLWTFYPVDLIKVNLQAGVQQKPTSLREIQFFRGIGVKTLHTITSSFAYFYLYSWIVSWWLQRTKRTKLPTLHRLVLSAVAAMLNVLVTCPLDVLSAQYQTLPRGPPSTRPTPSSDSPKNIPSSQENKAMITKDATDADSEEKKDEAADTIGPEVFYESNTDLDHDLKQDGTHAAEDLNDDDDNVVSGCDGDSVGNDNTDRASNAHEPIPSMKDDGQSTPSTLPPIPPAIMELSRLWKGLSPSLLLCSNPSIHFTIFDALKSNLLTRQQQQQQQGQAKTNLSFS